ncbi:hypothetical protein ABVT39_006755 [Epinephelus coioides]
MARHGFSPLAFSTNSTRRLQNKASSTPRLANQNRPGFIVKMSRSVLPGELPDQNTGCRRIPPVETRRFGYTETNVTFFMLADEPHRGQMKASPTEKERSRQRRPATGRLELDDGRFVLLECDYHSVDSVYFWK